MHNHYLFLALDLAHERAAEAQRARLASLAHPAPTIWVRARRGIARFAIAIARLADDATVNREAAGLA